MVKLDRCDQSCNTLNDLSDKVCESNKTEDLNLRVLNMITKANVPKTLARPISYKCVTRFDGRKKNVVPINCGIMINVDVSFKNAMYVKKIMFETLLHVIVKI